MGTRSLGYRAAICAITVSFSLSCGGGSDGQTPLLWLAAGGETPDSEAPVQIELTIDDASGQPVSDVSLQYAPINTQATVRMQEVRTDAQGYLSLYLIPGKYSFYIPSLEAGFDVWVIPPTSFYAIQNASTGGLRVWSGRYQRPNPGGSPGGNPGGGPPPDPEEPPEEEPNYFPLIVFVSGLDGSAVLRNVNGEEILLNRNGTHSFPTELEEGIYYSTSIRSRPDHQQCTLSNRNGYASYSMPMVRVDCITPEPTYTIGGTVVGPIPGSLYSSENGGGLDSGLVFRRVQSFVSVLH